jgi:predicted ATPase/DNA-binding winged helix-turn-helix (wHTH) protein
MTPTQADTGFRPWSAVFGPFRLEAARGLLLRQEVVCPLGGRALDILIALVEQAGQTVSKQDLMRRAWPNTLVNDANLRVQIAALRRVLDDGRDGRRFIVSAAGRGYRFIAPVTLLPAKPVPNAATEALRELPSWPIPNRDTGSDQGPIYGRDAAIEAIVATIATQRCVTLTGPGGVGKTTLAQAVLERLPGPRAARFVDVADIEDPAALLGQLQHAIENAASDGDSRLLMLDGCEHLAGAGAASVEALLAQNHQLRVFATSRGALRVDGECIIATPPLTVLPEGLSVTLAQARNSPAEQMFLDRAAACIGELPLTDADAVIITTICGRLEGLPLAIELLAAQVDKFRLTGLLHLIDDPALLAGQARRGGLARHASLAACVEWSLRTLSPVERTVLHRLATLPGCFNLTEAHDATEPGADAAILTLAAQSLIIMDSLDGAAVYRLPATTRAVILAGAVS